MDYFNLLPVEITLDIFSRLPAESVLECKLVSKTWNTFVCHPSFGKLHLNRLNFSAVDSGCNMGFLAMTGTDEFYYFEYNDESTLIRRIRRINFTSPYKGSYFVSSSNGLIYLAWYHYPSVCICNPITRECVILPKIKRDSRFPYRNSGFGYVSSTNEYKIVGIYTGGEVYIYTLGSGKGWRKLGNYNSEFRASRPGILANGVLYWLDGKLRMIVTFDLAEEKFCEHFSPPPWPPGCHWLDHSTRVLDGFLYICIRNGLAIHKGARSYDMWKLKEKRVNHEMNEQDGHQSSLWS